MLKSFTKSVIPRSWSRPVSVYRTVKRNRRRDQVLSALHEKYKLDDRHIRHLRVLPDREALLEQIPKGGTFAEVGVAEGEFSRMILDCCKPKKLYLIDLWDSESARYGDSKSVAISKIKDELEKGVADIRQGYSWDMITDLSDDSLDWIYIDAAHDYNSVTKDLSSAKNKVKGNGMICGHDYTRWSGNGLNRWGVVEAVNQFCINEEWEFLYLTNEPHRHLSFAIRRIAEEKHIKYA